MPKNGRSKGSSRATPGNASKAKANPSPKAQQPLAGWAAVARELRALALRAPAGQIAATRPGYRQVSGGMALPSDKRHHIAHILAKHIGPFGRVCPAACTSEATSGAPLIGLSEPYAITVNVPAGNTLLAVPSLLPGVPLQLWMAPTATIAGMAAVISSGTGSLIRSFPYTASADPTVKVGWTTCQPAASLIGGAEITAHQVTGGGCFLTVATTANGTAQIAALGSDELGVAGGRARVENDSWVVADNTTGGNAYHGDSYRSFSRGFTLVGDLLSAFNPKLVPACGSHSAYVPICCNQSGFQQGVALGVGTAFPNTTTIGDALWYYKTIAGDDSLDSAFAQGQGCFMVSATGADAAAVFKGSKLFQFQLSAQSGRLVASSANYPSANHTPSSVNLAGGHAGVAEDPLDALRTANLGTLQIMRQRGADPHETAVVAAATTNRFAPSLTPVSNTPHALPASSSFSDRISDMFSGVSRVAESAGGAIGAVGRGVANAIGGIFTARAAITAARGAASAAPGLLALM